MRTARISGLFLLSLVAALAAAPTAGAAAVGRKNTAQAAQQQYQQAQKREATLEVQPGGTRTQAQYLKVIQSYQKAEALAPTPLVAAASMVAIGRLYDEMGHLFDTGYFQKALNTYRYFLRMYPRALEAPGTLYAIAELEKGPLGDPKAARKSLESLIANYPSSDQADHARLELSEAVPTTAPASEQTVSSRGDLPAAGSLSETGSETGPETEPAAGGEESRHPARVRRLATRQIPGATRILIYLNGPVKFRYAHIAHPDRVYFDLSRAYLAHPHGMRLDLRSGFVSAVHVAQNRPHVVRVVLDIRRGDAYAASLLRHPYRLAIDVGRRAGGNLTLNSSQGDGDTQPELPSRGSLTPPKPTHSGKTSLTRALGLKIDRIVIDPGHGGFDTGAIGPNGLEEKTVTLAIARRLGRLIRQRLPGTQVIYTRDSDRFVPLEERTKIANEKKADLFISIHANSSTDPAARGVEVYYLNFSTSPEAMEVAARENALAQVPVHRLHTLLNQISLNDKIEESRDLASDVDHSLFHELRLGHVRVDDRGVKKAPFVVLIGAHMPSILVEVSFLSNPTDDRLLGEARYRQRIAQGLFDGVKRYLSSLNSLSFKEAKSSPATEP